MPDLSPDPVQIMADAFWKADPIVRHRAMNEDEAKIARQHVREGIAALEAAGFKIVGPRMTDAMILAARGWRELDTDGSLLNSVDQMHERIYQAIRRAAPTYGSEP